MAIYYKNNKYGLMSIDGAVMDQKIILINIIVKKLQ